MISLFSRLTDYGVDCHFRKDPSGRLVFLPLGPRKNAYFVDSKSDEEKIRAFVRMYRRATAMISFMTTGILILGLMLRDYARSNPKEYGLAFSLGIPLFLWLLLIAFMWMLWALYKRTVPSFSASLTEVGPDVRGQLSTISPRPRVVLVCLAAGFLLLAVALFVAVSHR
jgi:hypothetical protein